MMIDWLTSETRSRSPFLINCRAPKSRRHLLLLYVGGPSFKYSLNYCPLLPILKREAEEEEFLFLGLAPKVAHPGSTVMWIDIKKWAFSLFCCQDSSSAPTQQAQPGNLSSARPIRLSAHVAPDVTWHHVMQIGSKKKKINKKTKTHFWESWWAGGFELIERRIDCTLPIGRSNLQTLMTGPIVFPSHSFIF